MPAGRARRALQEDRRDGTRPLQRWVSPVRSDPGSRQEELGVSGELGRRMPASTVPRGQEARRREAARPGESGLSPEYGRKPGLLKRGAWRAHPGLRSAQSPPRGEVGTSRSAAGFLAFSWVGGAASPGGAVVKLGWRALRLRVGERWGRLEGAGDWNRKWAFSKPHPSLGFISY